MTQMERFTACREYYSRLFSEGEDGLLGFAACVTVLPGRRDEGEVVDRVGTVVRRVDRMTANELYEADLDAAAGGELAVAWVVPRDDGLVLVEETGWAGTSPPVLRALSWGGHRVVNARFTLTYPSASISVADNGHVERASLSNPAVLDAAPTLRPWLEQIDPDDDGSHPVSTFAVAEVLSGMRLGLTVFEGPWPAIWFRPYEERPQRPPGVLGSVDAELALGLQTATPAAYLDACRQLAAAVPATVGEADNPIVTAFLADISLGRQPDRQALSALEAAWWADYDLPDDAWPDPADPVWRRSMAGRVLRALATDLAAVDDVPRMPSSFVEARAVMAGSWDGFRDGVVADLRRAALA